MESDFEADDQMPAAAASANADDVPLTVTPRAERDLFHSAHTHNEKQCERIPAQCVACDA